MPLDMKLEKMDTDKESRAGTPDYPPRAHGTPGPPVEYPGRDPAGTPVALAPRGPSSPHVLASPHHDRTTDSPTVCFMSSVVLIRSQLFSTDILLLNPFLTYSKSRLSSHLIYKFLQLPPLIINHSSIGARLQPNVRRSALLPLPPAGLHPRGGALRGLPVAHLLPLGPPAGLRGPRGGSAPRRDRGAPRLTPVLTNTAPDSTPAHTSAAGKQGDEPST